MPWEVALVLDKFGLIIERTSGRLGSCGCPTE